VENPGTMDGIATAEKKGGMEDGGKSNLTPKNVVVKKVIFKSIC
jgi:hypothetical protein